MSKLKDIKHTVVGIALIVIVFGLSFAVTQIKGCAERNRFTTPETLEEGENLKVTVDKNYIVITDGDGTRKISKRRKLQVIKKDDGTVEIKEKMLYLTNKFHIGVEMVKNENETTFGMQWIRFLDFGSSVSISFNGFKAEIDGVSLSIERDLFTNSFIGLFYNNQQQIGIKFGMFF